MVLAFKNKVLIIGYGSVSKCALPMLLKHIKIPCKNITIVDFADKRGELKAWIKKGLRYSREKITPINIAQVLSKYVSAGGLIIDLGCIYTIHNREQHLGEFISLVRSVYESLPLADFRKEELPAHIKPIIQSSFSNTLSSLLPGGNLLTPFFLNLFLAGSTNTYLTCLAGIIATHQCQAMTKKEKKEIIQQSMFEASFMLKEIVKECNPILSVTISKAVKNAGMDSLDTIPQPSSGSGMAQDIVSHLASSLKQIIRENIVTKKDEA